MADTTEQPSAQRRVWAELPPAAEPALREALAPTDLQTLLIDVARSRAGAVTPARLMRRWSQDRFVAPGESDPRVLAAVEARLWSLLPTGFSGVELSPVAPLGTVSVLGLLNQNRVVSTVRGTEVVADPTNVLALEAAARRARRQPGQSRVDLAAVHRVIRAQRFAGPGMFAHFKLFGLVSSARDRGSGRTEAELIVDHLRFYSTVFADLVPTMRVTLTVSTFERNSIDERLDELLPADVRRDSTRTHGRGYYTSHALDLAMTRDDGSTADLGDGGLTDWTSRLLGDAKERCLTSCISVERIAALLPPGRD